MDFQKYYSILPLPLEILYKSVETLYDAIRDLDESGKKKLAEEWKKELGLKRSPMNYLLKTSSTELVGENFKDLNSNLLNHSFAFSLLTHIFNDSNDISGSGISRLISLKGLQGDASDNIKGVPGVGPASATALIGKYKSVETLYDAT